MMITELLAILLMAPVVVTLGFMVCAEFLKAVEREHDD